VDFNLSNIAGLIMLNHVWTLLVNQPVTAPVNGRLGELPQSVNYKEVSLPTGINSIRRLLFGSAPDTEMLHYRSQQLLTCVLNSTLAPYAFEFDPRHTYEESVTDFLSLDLYRPIPQLVNGTSTLGMNIHGSPTAPDAKGMIRHSFTLVTDGPVVNLTAFNNTSQVFTGLAANEQASLGISGYSFSLTAPTTPQVWLIEFLNRPTASLGTIMANIAVVGEPALNELFGITADEPYATFRNIFFDAQDLTLKCAAVTLALAYQTEKRRATAA
jgi:hypothetical protein